MTDRDGVVTGRWASLERWSPRLFLVGAVFILVFALHNAQVFLTDATFEQWLYPTVLLGRIAVFLGIVGLSVEVADRSPRLGRVGRALAVLAIVSATGLLALGILDQMGYGTDVIAVFGLGTVALTVLTYVLFGVAILRTGAYSPVIGALLLVAIVPILAVLFGRFVLPVRLLGAVSEIALFAIFVVVGYTLRAEFGPTDRAEPAGDTTTR